MMPLRKGLRILIAAVALVALTSRVDGQTPTPTAEATPNPFSRYTLPGQCEAAADRLYRQYWRARRRDTVVYAPATDSIPAPVLRDVRQCAARFSVATVSPRDLLGLAELYLWLGEDSLARQSIDRLWQVDAKRAPVDRSWPLYTFTSSLFGAVPTRIDLAREYLRRLDAVGAPAATWRLFAHTQFAAYAMTVNDRVTAEAEARAALAASRQMSRDDRIDWVSRIANAYIALTTPVLFTRSNTAALAILDTAWTDLMRLRAPGTPQQRGIHASLDQERIPLAAYGAPWPAPVHASAWFGANGDTVRPRRGVATLLVFTQTSCGGGCYEMFATLRRLHAKYGDRMDIVFMASTAGYYRNKIIPSPEVEADSAGSYYTKFMHLPVALAVETTSFQYIPDGRRRNATTSNQETYSFGREAMLVNRRGTIQWLGSPRPVEEALLDAMIQAAVQ